MTYPSRLTALAACAAAAVLFCAGTASSAGDTIRFEGPNPSFVSDSRLESDLGFERSPLISPSAARDSREVDFDTRLGALAEERRAGFGVGAGFEHQFRTDIDRGGRMSVTRFNAGVTAQIPFAREFGVALGFRYDLDDYRFSGTTMLAPAGVSRPWEDIHTFTVTAMFRFNLDEDWSFFGGPVFQIARESGASVRDSWIAGGAAGAQYVVSPELTVGLGVGIVTQIEDSSRIFPVILVHWEVMENLWLTTRSIAESTGDTGLELVYSWGGGIETAVGLAYRFRRFRLDSGGGVAPDGVGQTTYIPVWLRVGWRATPNLTVSAHGGLALAGELRLESRTGSRIGRRDYDPAGLLGVNVTFRF